MSRSSRRDRTNLGYEMIDVQACILGLSEDQFHKTYDYEPHPADSYKISYLLNGQEHPDDLYIKFYIGSNQQLILQVLSFHSDR
ncbi:hypothetical protein [Shewanella bicestrii]